MTMSKIPIITIDGPSGSGKGTVSRILAKKLGWNLLDSGAIYRVLALYAFQKNVATDAEAKLVNLSHEMSVDFTVIDDATVVTLSGNDVTDDIYTEECGNAASTIAALVEVRHALLARQRAFVKAPGLVADGRDMGTVVFPEADLKFFLDASIEERATRRYKQELTLGHESDLEEIMGRIAARDDRDRNRVISPMKPASDAILLDTSDMNVEQVVMKIYNSLCKADESLQTGNEK